MSLASDADSVRPTCPSPVPTSPSGAHLAAPTIQQEEIRSISSPPQLARRCPMTQGPGRAENMRTLMFPRGAGGHSRGLGSHQADGHKVGEERRRQFLGLRMAQPGWPGVAVTHHVSVHVFESMPVSVSVQAHTVSVLMGVQEHVHVERRARVCPSV